MRLVLIHGRAQEGRDPDELTRNWLDALHRGTDAAGRWFTLRPTEVIMPFYGDTLAEIAAAEPDTDDVPAREVSPVRPAGASGELPCDVLIDCLDGAGVDDAAIEAAVERVEPVNPEGATDVTEPSRLRSMLAWEWVQTGLSILDRYVPGVSARSIRWTTHDVAVYLDDRFVRDRINDEVARGFVGLGPGEPAVVVAHSLGSVVAYDVLRPGGAVDQPVHTLVTIGSPLGLRAVRRALAPLDDPPTVGRWLNAYDDRDVIALHPLSRDDFPFDPPIENHAAVRNDTFNHHGIEGYLSDPVVAAAIADAMFDVAGIRERIRFRSRTVGRRVRQSIRRR